ncbi:MAG: glutamate--tRNA ligase, partial [Parcubacteria group bacterium]|nr:glutamate--tRNA ligase [Parcubacteria group bacterium]
FHFGTGRTALFNYLFAKKHGGAFIVRIEDTDRERSEQQFEEDILESLLWLGLGWDEGPAQTPGAPECGSHGPYHQSARHRIHAEYIRTLIAKRLVYVCPHTPQQLNAEQEAQRAQKKAPRHICQERDSDSTMHTAEEKRGVLRFRVPEHTKISFDDRIRGPIVFDSDTIGDFVIAKDILTPLFHLAVTVDDHDMGITHIIRGEDHISNTPKQILLWSALFNEPPPVYAHIPLILSRDRSKMSKRDGIVTIREYRKKGYVPEALVNFMALLGWNPGHDQELFTRNELVALFSLDRVQKSGAVFDESKLLWMNTSYIAAMPLDELVARAKPFLTHYETAPEEYTVRVVDLLKTRIHTLGDLPTLAHFFFEDPEYAAELLLWKNADAASAEDNLRHAHKILSGVPADTYTRDRLREILLTEAARGNDRGKLLWPLRVALSGEEASPDPVEILSIIGKERALRRIDTALQLLTMRR